MEGKRPKKLKLLWESTINVNPQWSIEMFSAFHSSRRFYENLPNER